MSEAQALSLDTCATWLGRPVVLNVDAGKSPAVVRCIIIGESAAALLVRIAEIVEVDVRKELILAIEAAEPIVPHAGTSLPMAATTAAVPSLKANLAYFSQRGVERIGNLAASFRAGGVSGVARKVNQHVQWFRNHRRRDAEFDRGLGRGIDTVGPVELWRLRVPSANVRYAKRYQPVDPVLLRQALASLHQDLREFTFIDLGCGKGRALLVAAEHKFQQLIGVEFASQLTRVAQENCRQVGVLATILCQDAAAYRFPEGNLVVCLYNPFGPDVLNPVLDNLLASQTALSSVCYIVYVNPEYRECLDQRPQISCLDVQPSYAIWKASPSSQSAPSA